MEDKTTFTERTLKRIRSGERSPELKKKRNLSKIILIIDAILVLLIVFYFTNKNDSKKLYYSSKINYNDVQVRFSISNDNENKNYLFKISLKSKKKKKIKFSNYVAEVGIFSNNNQILKKRIGNNVTGIKLLPGEIRSFISEVGYETINDYLLKKINVSKPEKKSLFDFSGKIVNLNAVIVLNIEKKLSSSIEFKHEVK